VAVGDENIFLILAVDEKPDGNDEFTNINPEM
jgi:hypothetical protein